MAYIYQADVWSDSCGRAIIADLRRESLANLALLRALSERDPDPPLVPEPGGRDLSQVTR